MNAARKRTDFINHKLGYKVSFLDKEIKEPDINDIVIDKHGLTMFEGKLIPYVIFFYTCSRYILFGDKIHKLEWI
jgi:hypothetical protein